MLLIGYHYTTRQRWEEGISQYGLRPHAIREHEFERFKKIMPRMPNEAVWLWKEVLTPKRALVATLVLAEIHDDFDIVMLEVQYEADETISELYKPYPDDIVKLTCGFSAGTIETGQRPIDLVHCVLPPERLKIVWEGNVLDTFNGIHIYD